jgi:hypothetical protein
MTKGDLQKIKAVEDTLFFSREYETPASMSPGGDKDG